MDRSKLREALPLIAVCAVAVPTLAIALPDNSRGPYADIESEGTRYDEATGTASVRFVHATGDRALFSVVNYHCADNYTVVSVETFANGDPDHISSWTAPRVCDGPAGHPAIEVGELG